MALTPDNITTAPSTRMSVWSSHPLIHLSRINRIRNAGQLVYIQDGHVEPIIMATQLGHATIDDIVDNAGYT